LNKIIFGPVKSRRFGNSLGIDLSPESKQCNFDCLYCELAPTTTVDHQSDSIAVEAIMDALQDSLNQHTDIDVITLTANGEPTLYPHLAQLIDAIDAIKGDKETLILSNSATLTDPATFTTLLKLDQVKLSLDAVTPEVFKKIDRPHEGLDIHAISDALVEFSSTFRGRLFIEVLFVHGLNDSNEEVQALNSVLQSVECERIDIGTIDRPPAYPVQGLSYSELYDISLKYDADLPIHIASRQHAESCIAPYSDEEILNTLDKRPLTKEDIDLLFDEDSKMRLHILMDAGKVDTQKVSSLEFYVLSENLGRKRQKS
jgi:wyosine [tRNA(Phe)-imidazoG37] synthetase (radical SAM superfamily)